MGRATLSRALALGLFLLTILGPSSARTSERVGLRLTMHPDTAGGLNVGWRPPVEPVGDQWWELRALLPSGWAPVASGTGAPLSRASVPAGASAMELIWEGEGERGALRAVALVPTPVSDGTSAPRELDLATSDESPDRQPFRSAPQATLVSGRLLYRDRMFDATGYLAGSRQLPLRRVEVELRRAADDSLLAAGLTDVDGTFDLQADLQAATAVEVVAITRARSPGLLLQVVDAVGPGGSTATSRPHELLAASIPALAPGTTGNLGDLLLHDATGSSPVQALNLLDTALDALDLLATPGFLAAWPDSGSVPPVVWDPAATHEATEYTGSAFTVASPASGDTDGWADALLLCAMGDWVLTKYGGVDLSGAAALLDVVGDPRVAYGQGSALAFAAIVRAYRAATRQAIGGAPADGAVSQVVDLGFPPPLGFVAEAQAAVDLESRALATGDTVQARGQLSALNVAAMVWDLADGAATPDGTGGDDDPLDEPPSRWFALASGPVAALPANEAVTFEDLHEAWRSTHGQQAELRTIAVTQGGAALEVDAAEPDDDASSSVTLQPWVQPAPSIAGKVVLGELTLGDVDAVELTNTGAGVVDLTGWTVVTRRNGFGTGAQLSATMPAKTLLHPGRSLVLHEGGDPANNTGADLYFPAWSIPWRERDDGACTLRNAAQTAIDFVRWAGAQGADPSLEPIPPGQGFAGLLLAPAMGYALARDSLATDTNAAADFSPALPTLHLPNLRALPLRRLYPRADLDHMRIALPAGALLQVQVDQPIDDTRPLLAQLDADGAVLSESGSPNGVERTAVVQLFSPQAAEAVLRLRQDPAALTAGGVAVLAWRPAYAASLLAPLQLVARARRIDPLQDEIELTWANAGAYDSLRVTVDGAVVTQLLGTLDSAVVVAASGHHVVGVRPVSGGVVGAAAITSVFVGPTPCALRLWLDGPDLPQVLQQVSMQGFALAGLTFDGPLVFRDADTFASSYPPDSEAILTLLDPVDLTTDSRLSFVHAAHLAADGDAAMVELSFDDGSQWLTLATFRGTDHSGQAGDPADWTDGLLTPQDWVQQGLPLGMLAGERVRVRFRRVSDSAGESFGWTIDNIDFGAPRLDGTHWVAPDGDDAFGCGHPERAWRTVGAAAGVAALGDTIALTPGVFAAATAVVLDGSSTQALLPVPAGITVRGSGAGATILDGSAAPWALVAGPSTGLSPADTTGTVSGLTIQDAVVGARLDSVTLRLQDVELRRCATGVRLTGGHAELRRAVVADAGVGLQLRDGQATVSRCTFTGLDTAITAWEGADSLAIERSLLAFGEGPLLAVASSATATGLACNDWFSFQGLTAGAGVSDSLALANGVWFDPWFCDRAAGDYRLAGDSPLIDLPGCGPVGALGVGCSVATPVPDRAGATRTWLPPNVPNPFNPATRIFLELAHPGEVSVRLFDGRGRLVRSLHRGPLPMGRSTFDWDGRDEAGRPVASGVYHLRVEAAGQVLTRSVALVR